MLLWLAVIVAVTELETVIVLIGNVAMVAPAATVTFACTGALVLLEERLMPTPPIAAGPDSVTVPVALFPPINDVGEILTLCSEGALRVRTAVCDVPLELAVIVAVDVLWTPVVLTVKVAVVAPDATVTVAGTVARL